MKRPKLKLTEWTNTMSVGIAVLDRDHQNNKTSKDMT